MIHKCPVCDEEHDRAVSCAEHFGVDSDMIELEARAKRIADLEERGAVWNETFFGLSENGKDLFFDKDGYPQ